MSATWRCAYGHDAGDDCLRQVAGAIRSVVRRPGDLVARYGGEEFIVLLPDTAAPEALVVAERLRQRIAGRAIALPGRTAAGITASLGIACLPEQDAGTVDELVAAADRALYRAKSSGRNRTVLGA